MHTTDSINHEISHSKMPPNIKKKLYKIVKGGAIAGGGVFATFILQELSQLDFGSYSAIVAAFLAVVINAVKQILRTNVE